MFFINEQSIKIHYELLKAPIDKNKATLATFPGGPGFGLDLYKKQISFLAEQANILLFDPRGCGNSTSLPKQIYSFETFVDEFAALQEHLSLSKVTVLGTSYGAMAALAYAI